MYIQINTHSHTYTRKRTRNFPFMEYTIHAWTHVDNNVTIFHNNTQPLLVFVALGHVTKWSFPVYFNYNCCC